MLFQLMKFLTFFLSRPVTTRSDAIANPLRKLSSDSQTSSKPAASSVQVNKKGEWSFRKF